MKFALLLKFSRKRPDHHPLKRLGRHLCVNSKVLNPFSIKAPSYPGNFYTPNPPLLSCF